MDTKNQILRTALRLFNRDGSHKITTNHIAAELGISPGNLYYHYNNKEHIVRELLKGLIEEFNKSFFRGYGAALSISDLVLMLEKISRIIYDFRFFFLELATLLSQDRETRRIYNQIRRSRVDDFTLLLRNMYQSGLLNRAFSDREISSLVEIIWIYTEGCPVALKIGGVRLTRQNILRQLSNLHLLFVPHLKNPPSEGELKKIIGGS